MDLSFSRLTPDADALLPVADLAMLMAALSASQEAGAIAQAQAALDRPVEAELLLAPASGAFSTPMVQLLAAWSDQ